VALQLSSNSKWPNNLTFLIIIKKESVNYSGIGEIRYKIPIRPLWKRGSRGEERIARTGREIEIIDVYRAWD